MLNKTTDEQIRRLSEQLRALAHPLRLQMLIRLCGQECFVNRIWQQLKISQPLASQHLNRLRQAGLVKTERQGKKICYRIADQRILALLKNLCHFTPASARSLAHRPARRKNHGRIA